jgi:hypothetical protein
MPFRAVVTSPTPGKNTPGAPVSITVSFYNSSDALVDPTTVTFETYSPSGTDTDYVYGTDSEVTKSSTGIYVAAVTPDEYGRWHYRWSSTGSGTATKIEGTFLVQYSPWYDYEPGSW